VALKNVKMMKAILLSFLMLMAGYSALNAQIPQKPEDVAPLMAGESLPEASLQDENGNTALLSDVLKKGPTVLVFYRGGWCPYCNAQLSGLVKVEAEIVKLGYQIVAISPDDYQNLKPTMQEDKLQYHLYSDPNGQLIKDIGIAFMVSENTNNYIVKKTIGKVTEVLPVPTVMVVDKKSEILFSYSNPKYSTRLSEKVLIAVLKAL
jgi:peroxiredoxin